VRVEAAYSQNKLQNRGIGSLVTFEAEPEQLDNPRQGRL